MEIMKIQGVTPISPIGNVGRKTFADITNTLPKPRSGCQEDIPPRPRDELAEKLIKENLGMMKLIEEKNTLIELSGAELQKMRIHTQKLKLQNWNLAQSNSQMQAEVNVGRQRLRALQHELACKEAMLKAKKTQEDKKDAEACTVQLEVQSDTVNHHAPQVIKDEKPRHNVRTIRSRSMSSSNIKQASDQETAETKRPCTRRQSARFKSEQRENLFEIEDAKFSDSHKKSQTPPRRSSIGGGRPPRKAAEKVQSYKEIPLNMKLRRKE